MGSAIKKGMKQSEFHLNLDMNFAHRFLENPNVEDDDSRLSIFAMRRRLFTMNTNFIYHKAWLVVFENHAENKYATIEYSDNGIVLNVYEQNKDVKLSQVTANIGGIFFII